jgi:pyruvate dehydrogenase complex dehydrogenase (E1) component
MYLLRSSELEGPRVQLLGSGTILMEVMAAAAMLEDEWGVAADVWSVTSFTELRREGLEVDRWNMLHPTAEVRRPYVWQRLAEREGPAVASTDYIRAFPDQIRQWVPGRYRVLGTDGFGRSDYRRALRRFFEVDRRYVSSPRRGPSRRSACRKRSSATKSTPKRRCRRPYEQRQRGVRRGPGHRRLRGRADHRDPGLRG